MVGSGAAHARHQRINGHRPRGATAARPDLAGESRDLLRDIDLDIHAGEIVGIAGVEGNGQAELVEVIMGMREPTAGLVFLGDTDISDWGAPDPRGRGRLYPRGPAPARATARGALCGRTGFSATRPKARMSRAR